MGQLSPSPKMGKQSSMCELYVLALEKQKNKEHSNRCKVADEGVFHLRKRPVWTGVGGKL